MGRLKDPDYLVGKRFGKWTVMKRVGTNERGYALWECKCDCGTTRVQSTQVLQSGNSKSCGCAAHEGPLSIVGKKFGMIEVLEYLGGDVWRCKCDCGNVKDIRHAKNILINGKIKSCGCVREAIRQGKDLTGKVIGGRTVLKMAYKDRFRNTHWLCMDESGRKMILSGQYLRKVMRGDYL